MKFGSLPLDAWAAERHHGLRHVERNEGALRRPGGFDLGDRRQASLGGQGAEGLVEQLAERGRIDIADHGNPQRILRQHAADVILHDGGIDRRHALQRAVGLAGIGMVAEGDLQKLAAGQRRRVGRGPGAGPTLTWARIRSTSAALEARRGHRLAQQVEGFVPVVLEHPQRAAEVIPRRGKAELDGAAVEPLVEGLGIQFLGSLVEQAGDHVADAGLVGRILRRAAAEGIFHRDQRHGGVLHEPGLDAAGRNQALDLCRRVRRQGGEREEATAIGAPPDIPQPSGKMGHERFSSRFGAGSLIR